MKTDLMRPRHLLAIWALAAIAVAYGAFMIPTFFDEPSRWVVLVLIVLGGVAGIAGAVLLLVYVMQWAATIITQALIVYRNSQDSAATSRDR